MCLKDKCLLKVMFYFHFMSFLLIAFHINTLNSCFFQEAKDAAEEKFTKIAGAYEVRQAFFVFS